MASLDEVERRLQQLIERLRATDEAPASLRESVPEPRILALHVSDLDATYGAELADGHLEDLRPGEPEGEVHVRSRGPGPREGRPLSRRERHDRPQARQGCGQRHRHALLSRGPGGLRQAGVPFSGPVHQGRDRSVPPQMRADAYRAMTAFDAREHLPRVEHPALVVIGEADRLVDPEESRRLAAALPGSEVLALEDVGHAAFLEVPGALNDAVTRFVERVRRDRPEADSA